MGPGRLARACCRPKETSVLPLTKRQREILDYLTEFIQQHGYAPSLEEIGRKFSLSSLATAQAPHEPGKGFIRRA
jgi:repressor LexA